MSSALQTFPPRATRTMPSAVWNARESRCAGSMGRPAARRNSSTARAVPVSCGTISKFARAMRPPSIITCWCIPRQPPQLRSGWRCNDDQLTLISVTGPKRTSKIETNSGSSREISPVRGHHAPSISFPSRDARVSRTGLSGRRAPATEVVVPWHRCSNEPTITSIIGFCWDATATPIGSARLMKQPFTVRKRSARESGRRRNRIARDLVREMTSEATADNETARCRRYATICSDAARPTAAPGSRPARPDASTSRRACALPTASDPKGAGSRRGRLQLPSGTETLGGNSSNRPPPTAQLHERGTPRRYGSCT